LKSLANAGIAIEGAPKKFKRPQSFLNRARQPIFNLVVRISQAYDGELRTVYLIVVDLMIRFRVHYFSLQE
jgi:hypothetical protein